MRRPSIAAIAVLPLISALSACVPPRPAEAQTLAQTVAGPDVRGGDWFKQSGCAACHSITAYNVLNITAIAPDLSTAVADVPSRFGVSLDEFLQTPTGTMSMVLSTRIPMTPEQRRLAVTRLKEVYRAHQEIAGAVRPVASH